jgi:DNA-directed RNA polymerase subunit RPC12/RpoP
MKGYDCPYCGKKLIRVPFFYKPYPKDHPFHVGLIYYICPKCWRIIKVPIIVHMDYLNITEKEFDTKKIWNQS